MMPRPGDGPCRGLPPPRWPLGAQATLSSRPSQMCSRGTGPSDPAHIRTEGRQPGRVSERGQLEVREIAGLPLPKTHNNSSPLADSRKRGLEGTSQTIGQPFLRPSEWSPPEAPGMLGCRRGWGEPVPGGLCSRPWSPPGSVVLLCKCLVGLTRPFVGAQLWHSLEEAGLLDPPSGFVRGRGHAPRGPLLGLTLLQGRSVPSPRGDG